MSATLQLEASLRSRRRDALRRHPTQTGLDYVEVGEHDAHRATIFLHFLPPAAGAEKEAIPPGVTAANIRIAGSLGGSAWLPVEPVVPRAGLLTVNLTRGESAGADPPSYSLTLIDLPGVDPFFSQANFSFQVDEQRPFDCAGAAPPRDASPAAPEIDYLAKDYASFRKLMLDRLSLLVPAWRERSPADGMVATVETLAAAADHLSYFQDAMATESYLGTARQRASVRRHARLLDYPMHEGCTARTWVTLQVKRTSRVLLHRGTQLLTHLDGQPLRIEPDSRDYAQALASRPLVFETLHAAEITAVRNEIRFYTWGAREYWLPKGATSATLVDPIDPRMSSRTSPAGENPEECEEGLLELRVGDVLLFEEKRGAATGKESDADPEHRHAVRLTRVTCSRDVLGGRLKDQPDDAEVCVREVEWHAQDALPFPLCSSAVVGGRHHPDMGVVRGNVVLVEHGRSVGEELEPPSISGRRRYLPRLRRRGLGHSVPYDHESVRSQPASGGLVQDPRAALAAVHLGGPASAFGGKDESEAEKFSATATSPPVDAPRRVGELWSPRRDLLASDRFAREFVVEMEMNGSARLRFGDGVHGWKPPPEEPLHASYRIGNGTEGNVGRDSIAHLVVKPKVAEGITNVRNPLPARGGIDPEPMEQVRLYAPQAFRTPERCITEADYATVALRHPEVERAAALRRLVGSWQTMLVAVERRDGRPVYSSFEEELRGFLERFRLAGLDVQVRGPRYVAVEIALTVHVHADHFRSTVEQELLESFSNTELPDGRRGLFHRANFGFGEPVYLSRVLEIAMAVPGVAWVETTLFHRTGQRLRDELETGRIDISPLEIARLDNDADAPERGTIELRPEGGR